MLSFMENDLFVLCSGSLASWALTYITAQRLLIIDDQTF